MKKRANKFFVLLFSVVCVVICVLLANLLSSAITVSESGANAQTTTFSGYSVYAISLGAYTSKSSAESNCEEIMKKGGAGYVFKEDNVYHVLASAYEKENDAKLVQENLTESGISSTILKISIGEVSLAEVSSSSQKKSFLNSLAILKNCYLNLYDISVSLDTNSIDETKAKIKLIEEKSTLEKQIENLSKGNSAIDGIYYQTIKNTYLEIENQLTLLKEYENINGISLSAKIKHEYINVLEKLDDLVKSLNNEF